MWNVCPLKVLTPGTPGSFGAVQGAAGHDHEARADIVAAVRAEPPPLDLVVPTHGADQRVKERAWLRANPQGRHGQHSFSLAQWGFTKQDLAPYFSDYLRVHPVATSQEA